MSALNVLLFDKDKELVDFIIQGQDTIKIDLATENIDFIRLITNNSYGVAIVNPEAYKGNIEELVGKSLEENVPVLIVTEKFHDVEKVIDALSAGAFDYFLRPAISVLSQSQKEKSQKEILEKISAASNSKANIKSFHPEVGPYDSYDFSRASRKIIIIGSSAGGPPSLEQIIPLLPKQIPAPVILVQHMPQDFTKKWAERLDSDSEIKVKEAQEGDVLKNGVCYIAKGDHHLKLKRIGGEITLTLNKKEKVLGCRPSINVTMQSAAKVFGKNVIGIILTGMGSDGTVGAKKIKESNGTVIVQSEKTSIIPGMPGSVIKSGYYDVIVDLQKILVATLQVLEV